MKAKKYLSYLAAAVVVYWVITNPETGADLVRRAAGLFGDAAVALSVFVNALI
ncbi:hypothetical protein GCM10009799_03060 [Nocardiopsis rhodophaea]|uniref:Uncharacterized protein n=1 Tax=Nocardiopsis rhodophaea TaxID=280238 RepID=A0ABN2S6Z5_9ACTN